MQSKAEHFSRSAKKVDSNWLSRQSSELHSVAVVEAERAGSYLASDDAYKGIAEVFEISRSPSILSGVS